MSLDKFAQDRQATLTGHYIIRNKHDCVVTNVMYLVHIVGGAPFQGQWPKPR
jgi:hypothetical protein